ncbi:MAG TPA: choice-of-anchor D domain-containing protein, partial [Terriglobales bacterium]|nr:choice-of-anchor D domain-containing protein [Terriglobales bacterium]
APPDLDTFGLGPRVPLLVISPFSRKGYISPTQYEFSSVLKFIEERFGLAPLSNRDANANAITDSFNFAQTPLPPLILTPRQCPLLSAAQASMGTAVKGVPDTAIPRHLEIYNSRPIPLTIDSIVSSNHEFLAGGTSCAARVDCSTNLAKFCSAGSVLNAQSADGSCTASCSICVTFKPSGTGKRSSRITVTDSDSTSPQTALVSGLGTLVEMAPTVLQFLGTPLGTSSTLPVTLTNVGSAALNITSIRAINDYSTSNDCGLSVAPNATCTISVTFRPTTSGPRPGALIVVSSDPASPERVDLLATGLGITLKPAMLNFGSQTVGTTSTPQPVTITNRKATPVLMGDISATDDFIVSGNTCPATLGARKSCTIQIEFSPDEAGSLTGTIFVSDDDRTSPQRVVVSGTGR